jgi:hypothetical protein
MFIRIKLMKLIFPVLLVLTAFGCNGKHKSVHSGSVDDDRWDVSLRYIEGINNLDSAEIAIIFLHGLDGHFEATFQNAATKRTWFDIIREDQADLGYKRTLSQFHIYSVDYASTFSSNLSTTELVDHVHEALEAQEVFRRYSYLWFVAHSLGGIVIKKVLNIYRGKPRHLERVLGASLLGVPSQGSEIAQYASKAGFLVELFGPNYRFVEDLRPTEVNSFLEDTEFDWSKLIEDQRVRLMHIPSVYCAFEKNPTFARIVVVPELFTATYCNDAPKALDRDHIDLVKPPESGPWQAHDWLRRTIKQSLGIREKTDEASVPLGGTLADFVEDLERYYQDIDAEGFRRSELEVKYADAASERNAGAVRLTREYEGPTWRRILEQIDRDVAEVEIVENARDGRRIKLRVEGPRS